MYIYEDNLTHDLSHKNIIQKINPYRAKENIFVTLCTQRATFCEHGLLGFERLVCVHVYFQRCYLSISMLITFTACRHQNHPKVLVVEESMTCSCCGLLTFINLIKTLITRAIPYCNFFMQNGFKFAKCKHYSLIILCTYDPNISCQAVCQRKTLDR